MGVLLLAYSTVITSYILVVCVGSVLADEKKANSFLRRFHKDSSSTNIVQECCMEGCHLEEVREYCWPLRSRKWAIETLNRSFKWWFSKEKKKRNAWKPKGMQMAKTGQYWNGLLWTEWSSCNRTTLFPTCEKLNITLSTTAKSKQPTGFYLTWRARTKRIKFLVIKVKNVFLFFVSVFSKTNRKYVIRVSIELKKHSESLGELEKAMETLVYRLVFPTFHSCFYLTIRLWARDFYRIIEIESE